MKKLMIIIVGGLLFLIGSSGYALKPSEILVIVNNRSPAGVELARYYMEKRGIPSDQIVRIKAKVKERCSREYFETVVLPPIRRFLRESSKGRAIKCLLTVYGVPLVVNPPKPDKEDLEEITSVEKRLRNFQEALKALKKEGKKKGASGKLEKEIKALRAKIKKLKKADQLASLDSELSLARFEKYRLKMWLPNPYFVGYKRNERLETLKNKTLMVSRLDGPDFKTVKRIIDDSIRTESSGLRGVAYFDSRYTKPNNGTSAYAWYDLSIKKAADYVEKSRFMKVVLDTSPELFKPCSCPNAALYCGWYSLAKYVDAFAWVPGAIGYHIASSECRSLHNKKASYWCIKMLEKGVAATLGPVAEPCVQTCPPPHLFFKFLMEGKPLVEAYFLSKPSISWRMVLVGDPLYRPFKSNAGH